MAIPDLQRAVSLIDQVQLALGAAPAHGSAWGEIIVNGLTLQNVLVTVRNILTGGEAD